MKTKTKFEYCSKKVVTWLKENIEKIDCRTNSKDEIKKKGLDYCDRVLRSEKNSLLEITYQQSKNLSAGRYFAKGPSIQNLPREIRHTICKNEYNDIDMVNSQPTIMSQYCKKNNIPCPVLCDYVKKRDIIFEKMSVKKGLNKDDVKEQINKMINGGKPNIINSFFKKFHDECTVIIEKISALEENKILYNMAKNRKDKSYNIKGTVLNYVYTIIENDILMCADEFFLKKGYKSDVLVFDGLMIRKTDNFDSHILEDLDNHIYDKTGYKVNFILKPMNEGINIPEDEISDIKIDDNYIIIEDDKQASNLIINLIKNDIVKCNNRFFLKQDNFYSEDYSHNEKDTKYKLLKIISDQDYRQETKTGIKKYSTNARGSKNILDMVMPNLKNDQDFIKKMWNSNLKKLCFKNGYYDFVEKKLKPYDDTVITTIQINRNFNENVKKEHIQEVYDKILDPIFWNKEEQKNFLKWLARGVAGCPHDKTWGVGIGARNSGKGVICDLLSLSIGGYVGSFNPEEMLCARVGCSDMAKKLAWSVPLEFRRINFSNELKTEDDKGTKLKLDGTILKHIASGGDEQTARLLYKNEVNFRIQGRVIIFMNEMIEVSSSDTYKTLATFKFNTEFKDELTNEEKEINNLGGYKFEIADRDIKSKFITRPEIQDAFINILIDHYVDYEPDFNKLTQENNDDIINHENDDENKLLSIFEFTKNSKDSITVCDIDTKIKNSFSMQKSKYSNYLLKLGAVKKKNMKGYFYSGIKFKD